MSKFKGATALITGASSGIGAAIAAQLAEQGTHLIVVARREDRLEALKQKLEADYGIKVTVIAKDLSEAGAAESLFRTVKSQNLAIDLLVNNAGFGRKGKFHKEPLSCYQQMMQLNISTMTELTYLFSQQMMQRGDGYILQVASIAGYMPVPGFAVYAATKSYVLNFGRAIHHELAGKNVHVTTLCPGATETEFLDRADIHVNRVLNSVMMSSEDAARCGLEGLSRHAAVVVPGAANRLMLTGLNCVPRKVHGTLAEIAMR